MTEEPSIRKHTTRKQWAVSCQGHKVGYAGLRERVENENVVCVRYVSPGRSTVVRKRGMVRGVRKMLRFQTKTRAAVVHGPVLAHEGAVWRPPAPAQVRLVARAARRVAARRPVHPRPRRSIYDRALRPHGARRDEAGHERSRRGIGHHSRRYCHIHSSSCGKETHAAA